MSDAGVEQTSLSLKKADMTNDVEKMEADCTDHKVTTDAADSSKSNGLPASGAGDNKQSVDVKTKTEQKTVEESKCKTDKSAEEKESPDDNVEPTKSPTKRKSKAVEKEADSSPKKKSKKETTAVPDEDTNKSAKTSKSDETEEVKEEKKNPKQKADKKKEESSEDEDEGSDEDDDDDEKAEAKQPGLLERPVVLEEGCKREKKKVQRLEVTPVHNERKSLSIVEGSGTKLGDIPRIELQLQKFHGEDLKPLHRFLFDRVEKTTMVKRNIRLFSGFTFSKSSTEFNKKKDRLGKFTSPLLKMVCEVLDLERKGKKEEIIDRIMDFLMKPESSGKPLPKPSQKRRRSSSVKKSSPKSKDGEKKPRKKKEKKDAEAGGSDASGSESEKEADEEDKDKKASEEKSESEKEAAASDDDNDEPKKKKKKSTPAKKAPKPKAAKKTPKSESKKPAKKTAGKKKAKAESSSDDSSDDDEPLEKKKKGPPTDGMLKDVIKKILKTANLEEVTMKTVCKQVYDKYPEFDLTSRKDFIKTTVKQILK